MNDTISEAINKWMESCKYRSIPEQHIIFLNNQFYATYDDYNDALYDFNILKENPKNRIYLLKNYWISGMNFEDNDIVETIDGNQISVTLRYDTLFEFE